MGSTSINAVNEKDSNWYLQLKDIDVPQVQYLKLSWKDAIIQGLKRFLAPTTSAAFLKKDLYFHETFADQVKEYITVRNKIKQLYLVSRSHRLSILSELLDKLQIGKSPEQWDNEVDHVMQVLDYSQSERIKPIRQSIEVAAAKVHSGRAYQVVDPVPSSELISQKAGRLDDENLLLIDKYLESINKTSSLKSHLEDVEKDLEHYSYLVSTQATAELTYFRGLRDWATVMVQLTDGLSSALIAISTLGAGLVYSTVFGAARGNVGLMTYTFPFFSLGFLVPVVVQILTRWAAGLQKEVKFASQHFWTIVIGLSLSLSSIAVMAALTILNLTIFFLRSDPDDSNPQSTPQTEVPGIIAFGISGSIFVLIFAGAMMGAIAARAFTTLKGIKGVVSAMYGSMGHQEDALMHYLPV